MFQCDILTWEYYESIILSKIPQIFYWFFESLELKMRV